MLIEGLQEKAFVNYELKKKHIVKTIINLCNESDDGFSEDEVDANYSNLKNSL